MHRNSRRTKELIIFEAKPEVIKVASLFWAIPENSNFETKACVRETLDQGMEFFEITADYDPGIMKFGKNLCGLTADIIV